MKAPTVKDESGEETEGVPPYTLYDADRDGAIVADERRGTVLGLDARGRVVWRDRPAYANLEIARCLARCPDGVLSGLVEGDSPERRDPPIRWHTGRRVSVDRHRGTTKYKVLIARSRSDLLAVGGDGVRYQLLARSPGAPARRTPIEGPLEDSYEAASDTRLLVLNGSASESSDRSAYRWFRRARRGWVLVGKPGRGAFDGACIDSTGSRAVLVGETGARNVKFGSNRESEVRAAGGEAGDCALGRGTLLSVLQRQSAGGEDEALLRLSRGGKSGRPVRIKALLDRFALAPNRPVIVVLTRGELTAIRADGSRRVLRRGVADFLPTANRLAVVTQRGQVERVAFPAP